MPGLSQRFSIKHRGITPDDLYRIYLRKQSIYFSQQGNGCKWRNLPADLPLWHAAYDAFCRWWNSGDLDAVHTDLREQVRRTEGREPEPTAAVIDSQSIRSAETISRDSRGWDAGKKVAGRKRHVIVDCLGLLLVVLVTGADIQDRDGARPALTRLRACSTRSVWCGPMAPTQVCWSAG
ncbi:transposase [Nocardia amamiensis]|uniref:transposase n=1 Tax=Nocardia TaxID=1817 RepID=UPI003404C649